MVVWCILIVMNTRAILLAYAAGVIDSDGSITIASDTWRVRVKGCSQTYSENVSIGQCDSQALDLLVELFGGKLRVEKPRTEGRRAMFYWSATDKRAVKALTELLPYLRIKRRQAEIVLRLRDLKNRGREFNTYLEESPCIRHTRWGPREFRRRFLKPEVIAEYDALLREVRALNDTRYPEPV